MNAPSLKGSTLVPVTVNVVTKAVVADGLEAATLEDAEAPALHLKTG